MPLGASGEGGYSPRPSRPPLFLRCARCCTHYELEAGIPAGRVVCCARCGHAAPAVAVELPRRSRHVGGAARTRGGDPADEARWALPFIEASLVEPLGAAWPPRGFPTPTRGQLAAVALAAAATVGLVLLTSAYFRAIAPEKLPPFAAQLVARGVDLLLHDDELSLERATAAFGEAREVAPERQAPAAWEAIARAWWAASLLASAEEFEAGRAHARPEWSAEREAERLEDDLRRARVLRTRADQQLARAWRALGDSDSRDPYVQLALALVRYVSGDTVRTAEHLRGLQRKLPDDPFVAWLGTMRQFDPRGSGPAARAQLEDLLHHHPHLVRARMDLALLHLATLPPQLDQARAQLERILAFSPPHQRARRLLARVQSATLANAFAAID